MSLFYRLEKANAQIITRSRSGGPQSGVMNRGSLAGSSDQVSGKATPEEIKEKIEQQLRMQRAAHQQKRALETLKNPSNSSPQLLKVTTNTNQGKNNFFVSISIFGSLIL